MNTPMPLALSADLPLVWESPDRLRIGVARPIARLDGLSPAEQRFLSVLTAGVSEDRLAEVTKRCGLTHARRTALLARIADALGPPPPGSWTRPTPPLRVCIAAGEGSVDSAWARVFAAALASTGPHCAMAATVDAVTDADFLVLPERYAAPRAQLGPWLSLGLPTLSIRLRDRSVLLGPLLGTNGAPCLDCCNQAELARDPAWAVITAQVSGSRPPSETSSVALALAAHVAALLEAQAGRVAAAPSSVPLAPTSAGGWDTLGAQLELPVHQGLPRHGGEHRQVPRRAECACATLEALEPDYAAAGTPMPAAARKRDGVRRARPPAAEPESRSSSRARVSAT